MLPLPPIIISLRHRMDLKLIIYIVLTIVIGFGGVMTFFRQDRFLTSIVFLAGSILVFVFFGLRWFQSGPEPGTSGVWPPVINTCPDFLTYYKRTKGTGINITKQDTCIDTVGVSRDQTKLAKWPADGSIPADDKYYFDLTIPGSGSDEEKRTTMCQRTIDYGLTWEGVTDGQVCYNTASAGGQIVPPGTACPKPAA